MTYTSSAASVLAMPRALSLATAMFLLLGTSLDQVHAVGSFQNGRMNGAIYAGAVDYSSHDIFITGVTYGTNGNDHAEEAQCFVSKFSSTDIGEHSDSVSKALGDGIEMQACHTLSVLHDPLKPGVGETRPFVVAGTADLGATIGDEELFAPSGFVVTLKQEQDGEFPFRNSVLTDDVDRVSHPISIRYVWGQDSDGTGDHFNKAKDRIAYVASVTSSELFENPGNMEVMIGSNQQPNWIRYYKYGSTFDLCLQKFVMPNSSNKMEESWTKCHPVDIDSENGAKADVYVGGMIVKRQPGKDFLIVAGSTNGSGSIYGQSVEGSVDEDGFIAVFNGHTGQLRGHRAGVPGFASTARLGTPKTDLILGICDDHNDSDHFYVVGTTGDPALMGEHIRGKSAVLVSHPGSLHGFVQKIDLNTLQPKWAKTWSANFGPASDSRKATTAGYGCRVLDDGSLYIAGVAENGAHVMRDIKNNHEFDDIVAMRLTSDGDLVWMTQFGSKDGNEELARSGSVAIDHDENLVIFGDTSGSLFRKREDTTDNVSDVFLVTLSKTDGTHDEIAPESHAGGSGKQKHPFDEEPSGMMWGGKWKDDEVYDTAKWLDMEALGIQSGPTAGSVYAGGMVYDIDEDTVYVTGIAYEETDDDVSSCMATKLPLNQAGFRGWGGVTGKLIGDGTLDVCYSIALHGYGEVVVAGSAEKGSDLQKGNSYPMAGFALALDRVDMEEVDVATLTTEDPNNRIAYPIDIVVDEHDMYIVSLTSTDVDLTPEAMQLEYNGYNGFAPNWINLKKYGSSIDMTVTKVTLDEKKVDGISLGEISFTEQWTKEFPVNPDENGNSPRVYLGGAILKKADGYLAVSGSTRGFGEGYGAGFNTDEDGFVALLDMKTGELASNVSKNTIREGTSEDDFVFGMCHDPNDSSSFYVAGATKGVMPGSSPTTEMSPGSEHAILLKVDAKTLKTLWVVQLGAERNKNDGGDASPTTAKALDCVVSGDTIYVGGIVDDGAGMVFGSRARSSRGGDDVWIGSISTEK